MERRRWQWMVCLTLGLVTGTTIVSQSGCRNLFTLAAYAIKGTNVPPDYKGLKGHTVAVICRPLTDLEYSSSGVATDISARIAQQLRENGRKVKVIDERQVAEWVDEHGLQDIDFADLGKAVGADRVLAIDLEGFSLYQGQTVYQGKADVTVRVIDVADGSELYVKTPTQTVYPQAGTSTQEYPTEGDFRKQFVSILCREIGCLFYEHDPSDDFARDSDL